MGRHKYLLIIFFANLISSSIKTLHILGFKEASILSIANILGVFFEQNNVT